jgi:hypothetical protein
MSLLGQAVFTLASAQSDYAAKLPGGLHPDTNPVTAPLPYGVYQSVSKTYITGVDGKTLAATERVQITIVAKTRTLAQSSAAWLAALIKNTPAIQTVGSLQIKQMRCEDQTTTAEIYADGSDEAARIHEIDIIGTYKEN